MLHAMTTCILGWTLLRGGAPLAVARDGLAFKDRLIENGNASVTCNRDPALVDQEADQCNSAANSVGMNELQCLAAPEKRRGTGRPTSSREKALYEGLSKSTRFCSICRREGHKRTTCPERGDAPKKPRKRQMPELRNRRTPGNTCKRPLGFAES